MDFLASKESLSEFIGAVLAIPGHLDLQVDYKTDNPLAKHALETFAGAVPTVDSIAFDLQALFGYSSKGKQIHFLLIHLQQ